MGKVFISYSRDPQAHRELVLKFSHLLREFEIDVVLDQYEDQPPESWPKWMDIQIKKAEFVIIICTKNYWLYTNGIDINGKGKGVYFESTLIYEHIYEGKEQAKRFIPVIFNKNNLKHIPTPLKGRPYYCVDKEDEAEALYRRLTHQSAIPKPELGQKGEIPAKDEKAADFTCRLTQLVREFYQDDPSVKEDEIFAVARENLKDNFDFIEKEPIGTGTYSRVYAVYHKIFKEYHALKILDFDRILRKVDESKQVLNLKDVFEEKKERFLEKVRFFDQFRGHPNILNIVDAGVVPFEYKKDIFKIPYLLSKYIKGVRQSPGTLNRDTGI